MVYHTTSSVNHNCTSAKNKIIKYGTATGAPNSCSYTDLAVAPIDESIFAANYDQLLYYGRYRDDCLVIWCGSKEELNDFFVFLNSLSEDLKFTMEIGNDTLCFWISKFPSSTANWKLRFTASLLIPTCTYTRSLVTSYQQSKA